MQRYFGFFEDGNIRLGDAETHHLLHVNRAKLHEQIEVVVDGKAYICSIQSCSPFTLKIEEILAYNAELEVKVNLLMCLAKGEKLDLIIQKATELGANNIVLINSERCIVKYDNKDVDKKLVRFNKIAKEACEQSHRLVPPKVLGIYDIKNIPQELLCDVNFVAYEGLNISSKPNLNINNNQSVSILIGPEGGLSEKEVQLLLDKGFKTVSLGKRILRCETAAIYAMSVLSYIIENK